MQIITAIVMFLTGANQISIHNYLINIFAHKQVHTSAVVHVHRAKKIVPQLLIQELKRGVYFPLQRQLPSSQKYEPSWHIIIPLWMRAEIFTDATL